MAKKNQLGLKIKEKRLNLGLTQRTLAKKINLSHTYISDIEVGRTIPPASTLNKILYVLEGDYQEVE